ncbi:MFS transporter [Aliikangiella coralliicola]|uniref:MFS transporter n=1 Tax=Aliikangiella coralliicola TaxID=2592383 RepID=A0A545UCB6_9GAMM|nr:MFS transporter [Aliikangiella coralliicola]TQV87112.1 MFS transporter [Aliikangiella coralliicola]
MREANTRGVIILIMLLQFVFLTTTMMIMPLGPELAESIAMDPADIGYLNGFATLAAAIAGIMLAPILDRYDRRKLLLIACLGKAITTLLCAVAWDTQSLIFILIISALFGGPAGAVMLSVIMDLIPPQQRGKAMAMVSSAFSLSAIIGIPTMLQLASWKNWTLPFLTTGVLGATLCLVAVSQLPKMTEHINREKPKLDLKKLLSKPEIVMALALVSCHMLGHFMIVPNIATFFVFNLDYPKDSLGLLYLVGGIASLITLQLTGRILDKGFPMMLASTLTAIIIFSIIAGFIAPGLIPVMLVFALFMAATSARNSSTMAVVSKIPAPHERAGFMSFYTTVGNISAGLAGFVSAQILSVDTTNEIQGMPQLAGLAVILMSLHPVILFLLLRREKSSVLQPG